MLAPLVASHPYLDVDPKGFATDPSLVRVFLARRTSHEPLLDQWLRFKAQLREHASALWFVDPVEVASVIRGIHARSLLRDAWTRRLAPDAFGQHLSSLWYAHATSAAWGATTSVALDVHLRSLLAALAASDHDEIGPTRDMVAGDTDALGNELLGSAATLALHGAAGHHLAPALRHVLQMAKDQLNDGDGVDQLRRCLRHVNCFHESTRSLLRRLAPKHRDQVLAELLVPMAAHLRSLGQASVDRFNDLAEARAFVLAETSLFGTRDAHERGRLERFGPATTKSRLG